MPASTFLFGNFGRHPIAPKINTKSHQAGLSCAARLPEMKKIVWILSSCLSLHFLSKIGCTRLISHTSELMNNLFIYGLLIVTFITNIHLYTHEKEHIVAVVEPDHTWKSLSCDSGLHCMRKLLFVKKTHQPKEFLAIKRAISLNETFVLLCWNDDWRN